MGISLISSIPVIGQEIRCLLDIDVSALPPIVSNNTESVVSFYVSQIPIVILFLRY